MRKSLKELAEYLKKIVVPETKDMDSIHDEFLENYNKVDIYEGINSFRLFLLNFYDTLIEKAEIYDTCKKIAHEYEDRVSLSVYYPFLNNVKNIMLKIGYFGEIEHGSIICSHTIFDNKLSTSKTLECLTFLTHCGIEIESISLIDKKQDLSMLEHISFSYPKDNKMWIGMKIMAIAEIKLGTLLNQDTFLRCDSTILRKDPMDELLIVKDTIKTLPIKIQKFVLELHHRYIDKGLKCVVEIKGYWIYIKYMYKRKDAWGLNFSLNNGLYINSKTLHTKEYQEVIETLSPDLQQIITKGFGCGRKISSIGNCNGGCRGMHIPLDDSVLYLKQDIEKWFDTELLFL